MVAGVDRGRRRRLGRVLSDLKTLLETGTSLYG